MHRAAIAVLLGCVLAGCSHTPSAGAPAAGAAAPATPDAAGCTQARWQAETVPVISKRQGQDALDRYEADGGDNAKSCP